jgi:hypothetical protein
LQVLFTMNTKKHYIFFCVAKLPLLVLYISFFTVQLFFNFDITQAADNTIQSIHQSNKCKSDLSAVKKAGLPSDKKTTVRLNKRYQPRTAITCDPLIIQPLICLTSSKLHIHYSTGFIPSSFPPAHSLRGPPFVA